MKIRIFVEIKKIESNNAKKRLYIDDIKTIEEASKSRLEISLCSEFHLYVGEFKMNHENKNIIKTAFSSIMLLNIISFIDISRYLNFLEHKKLNIEIYQ